MKLGPVYVLQVPLLCELLSGTVVRLELVGIGGFAAIQRVSPHCHKLLVQRL